MTYGGFVRVAACYQLLIDCLIWKLWGGWRFRELFLLFVRALCWHTRKKKEKKMRKSINKYCLSWCSPCNSSTCLIWWHNGGNESPFHTQQIFHKRRHASWLIRLPTTQLEIALPRIVCCYLPACNSFQLCDKRYIFRHTTSGWFIVFILFCFYTSAQMFICLFCISMFSFHCYSKKHKYW